jgi:hypothetical protein
MEPGRPDTVSSVFERRDERLSESIVLVLPEGCPGGVEKGLGGIALSGSFDLKVRRGGERKFLSWALTGEGGGEPESTISTVTIGVERSGRGTGDRPLEMKWRPVSSLKGR